MQEKKANRDRLTKDQREKREETDMDDGRK